MTVVLLGMATMLSGQLITVSKPSTDSLFNTLISVMASDADALGVGNGEANATVFDKLHWDASENKWEVGSFSSELGDVNFQLQAQNEQFFKTSSTLNIGFVSNENWDLNELFVNASKTGFADQRFSLFEYSDNVPANDVPGATASILATGLSTPVVLKFEHINQTLTPFGPVFQANEMRFNMFRQVFVDVQNEVLFNGNSWLFGINDRDKGFDADGDDGYFYITGDISPVPEPSSIAFLSVGMLIAITVIKRRFSKKVA